MSLLDKGRTKVTVFPEETYTDVDGVTLTRPSKVGIETLATVQPSRQSGTSARRAETWSDGFLTEEVVFVRFPRSFTVALGAQGQMEWNGNRWSVFGEPDLYNGSNRTAHYTYSMRRS